MSGVPRSSITKEYINNQVTYLKLKYPEFKEQDIRKFVVDDAQKRLVRPKVQIISHDNFNSKLEVVDLLTQIRKFNNKTITPSGTWYETSDVHKAPDIDFMMSRMSLRASHKKMMLDHREHGQFNLAMLEDFRQGMVKIGSNSIIGASGSQYSILYDLENFNAITSLSRHGVMAAYVLTERFISHNFHFTSNEEVINHIITTVRACPPKDQIDAAINKYKLVVPFPGDILDSLMPSMTRYYKVPSIPLKLMQLLEGLAPHQRVFVAYHLNMRYLAQSNPQLIRSLIDTLFDVENIVPDPTIELVKISSFFDKDLTQLISVTCGDLINGRILGSMHNPSDSSNYDPDTFRRIVSIGRHMQSVLSEIEELFNLFMCAKCVIPRVDNQKNLTRRNVILSDTDSVVFTTNEWVTWYCGKQEMGTRATRVSNLVMFWLSKALDAYIYHMSYTRGAIGEFTKMIRIKNEYMFPILVRCDIAKHYFALKTIQEGKILNPPQLEIKGLQFKDSKLPAVTNEFTETLITDVLMELNEKGTLNIHNYIARVLEYEKTVYDSIMSGSILYVGTQSIKHAEEYKDATRTIHKNYLLWMDMFADKYGPIRLPTKVPTIPLTDKMMNNPKYLDWLCAKNKHAYNVLMKLEPKDRAKITRMPMSGTVTSIPEELLACADVRSIVYTNIRPAHLILKSFKVELYNHGVNKRRLLLSDIYSNGVNLS